MSGAVGYVRVSTDRQADQGFGLAAQKAAIQRWASGSQLKVLAVLADEGVSGTTEAVDRPALSSALRMLADGEARALVVPRLDRLARSLSVQEACLAQIWNWGATVYACDLGEIRKDDPSDPMRTALRQMVAVFGQLERAMITARMRDGRAQKALSGGYAYGAPPYGYASREGDLVRVDTEVRTIKRARDLAREGLSLRQIAERLDAEDHLPRRALKWHPQTVARMLSRTDLED